MATSINCCLNMPTQTPPNTLLAPLCPPKVTPNPSLWRNRCFSSVASIIISSSLALPMGESYNYTVERFLIETQGKAMRWSDRRMCPQWRANLLENVVPENLPRRSNNRRRLEAMAAYRTDQAVGVLTEDANRCFFL
ncbi:protein CHLOROPLAST VESICULATION-like isoform X1 [Magnolia sinica]|uniref:protein CHLOROPLAST VESICULATION-like isoform X1 n=1 Tax=Magnolia sinica TaxID=86752 RepID=UPI00265A90F3|nr:protein CHLOROPLAST VESICULATION-like isoform X1 [Magnolia sinica]